MLGLARLEFVSSGFGVCSTRSNASSSLFDMRAALAASVGFAPRTAHRGVTRRAVTRAVTMDASRTDETVVERLKKTSTEIILGSGSATRRAILSGMGIDYVIEKPDIDEKAIRFDDPKELVEALARAKAKAVVEKLAGKGRGARRLLVTCDQVVVHRGMIREKPSSAAEAREFIRGYGIDPPSTVGSTMITDLESGQTAMAVDVNTVVFDAIPDDVVDAIVEEGECMYCAGGLMVEHPLVQPYLKRIEGTMEGIMGLDSATVSRLLDEFV